MFFYCHINHTKNVQMLLYGGGFYFFSNRFKLNSLVSNEGHRDLKGSTRPSPCKTWSRCAWMWLKVCHIPLFDLQLYLDTADFRAAKLQPLSLRAGVFIVHFDHFFTSSPLRFFFTPLYGAAAGRAKHL